MGNTQEEVFFYYFLNVKNPFLVIYSYEQALLCLGYMPDIWYEAAFFQQQAAQRLAEKGDVKLSTAMYNDIIRKYFLFLINFYSSMAFLTFMGFF